jgi:hypothetical protein
VVWPLENTDESYVQYVAKVNYDAEIDELTAQEMSEKANEKERKKERKMIDFQSLYGKAKAGPR